MGFKESRRLTIQALKDGRFQHEPRDLASGKNLLATGDVSAEFVIEMLGRCRGTDHETDRHHFDETIDVDIFKPRIGGVRWYIKSYLVECDGIEAVFISVHESEF